MSGAAWVRACWADWARRGAVIYEVLILLESRDPIAFVKIKADSFKKGADRVRERCCPAAFTVKIADFL